MLSLYIHIPFCDKKCGYCNFTVVPTEDLWTQEKNKIILNYIDKLKEEIISVASKVKWKNIKTIYFGGGTPALIGETLLKELIDCILTHFDCEYVEELSIELNPQPCEEILDLVEDLSQSYDFLPRVRLSFGIQTLDDELLNLSGRQTSFVEIQHFLRNLALIKKSHVVYNADFIAFGKKPWEGQVRKLWDQERRDFFQAFVQSQLFDSFSVYMLELFEGSDWYLKYGKDHHVLGNQGILNTLKVDQTLFDADLIAQEFEAIKEIVEEWGYRRYEVSNFSLLGKSSIHNRVYRSGGDYLGLGVSASSYLHDPDLIKIFCGPVDASGVRWTQTKGILPYIKGEKIKSEEYQYLATKDTLIEQFFLGLRSDFWVKNIDAYASILVKDYKDRIQTYIDQKLLIQDRGILLATDHWLNVVHQICIELIEEF